MLESYHVNVSSKVFSLPCPFFFVCNPGSSDVGLHQISLVLRITMVYVKLSER